MTERDFVYVVAALLRAWTLLGLILHVWLRGVRSDNPADEKLLVFISGPAGWVANLISNGTLRKCSVKMAAFHIILALMLLAPIGFLTCGRW